MTDIHPALYLPQPKGHRCPACTHLTFVHREHGCDSEGCECTAPHGRIMPADAAPDPGSVLIVDRAEARERLARHLYFKATVAAGMTPAWDKQPGWIQANRLAEADVLIAVIAGNED